MTSSSHCTRSTSLNATPLSVLNLVIVVDLVPGSVMLGDEILQDINFNCIESLCELGEQYFAITEHIKELSPRRFVRLCLISAQPSVVVHYALNSILAQKWRRAVRGMRVATYPPEGGASRSWALDALRAAHNVLRRQEGSTGASTRNQIVFMSPFNMPIEGPLHETLRALTRERVEVELCSIVSPVLQHQTVGVGGAAGLLKLRKLQDTYLNLRLTRVHNELGSYHGLMKRLIGDTVAAVPRSSRLVIGAQEVACSVQMGAVSLGFRLEPGDRHVTEVQLHCIASVPLEAMSACFFFDVPYFVGASTDAAMPIEVADANLTKFVSFVSALRTAGLGVLVQANTLLPVCAVSPATMPLYFLSPPHGTGEEGNGLLLMHRVVSRDTVLPIILPNLDGVQDLQQEAMFKEALLELKKDCYDPLQWPSIN